jgi:hypothetical protein
MTVVLIKVISCNALLRVLLPIIRSNLEPVLTRKFLIMNTHHPDTLYIREPGCEGPWLFFKVKRGLRAQMFGKHRFCEFLNIIMAGFH